MRWRRREAKASDSSSPKLHRRMVELVTVHMKSVIFTLPHCASSLLFFLLRQRRGAAGLGEMQWARGSFGMHARAPLYFMFSVPNLHTKFLTLLCRPPRPFFS
jgi:hypothetical protein